MTFSIKSILLKSTQIFSNGILHLQEDICIGCGVCSANCPSNAITLILLNAFKSQALLLA
ncbi:MAG: hypothetical protein EU551_01460 [Promethearchaeota archaeon]|nr:MAG: hypothetical protein EU551_01460 [Candidatus Lokiarchaeota archaeon]